MLPRAVELDFEVYLLLQQALCSMEQEYGRTKEKGGAWFWLVCILFLREIFKYSTI